MVPIIFVRLGEPKRWGILSDYMVAASHKERPSFMGRVHPSRHHVLKKKRRLRQIECILFLNLPFPVFFTSLY